MAFIDFWNQIKQAPSFRPKRLYIQPKQTDKADAFFDSILPKKHYFSVRINEVFLSYSRKWTTTFDPLVFTVAEFNYDGKKVTVPFAVGPTLMKGKLEKIPEGMVFQDTRVAGLHPYSGGPVALSIVLCRVRQTQYLQKFLEIVEETAATYTSAFSTVVSDYIKVANVVMKGVESLLGMDETEPLAGFRREFDVDAGDDFKAGYYVLFNADLPDLDESKLWVVDNQLLYGDTVAGAQPFRQDDYVLYSIVGGTARFDENTLPFYAEWQSIASYATQLAEIDEQSWSIIRAKMFGLQDKLRLSPDLTPQQSAKLFDAYKEEILQIKNSKNFLSTRTLETHSEWEKSAMEVLNM